MDRAIGVSSADLAAVAQSLNRLLADEHVLYIKTRNAHWNIEGIDFHLQHKFFEEQYKKLESIIDDVAERIRALGHYAVGSMQKFLELSHLMEQTRERNDSRGYIRDLLADHETIILHIRENIGRYANEWHDQGSSDFITDLMKFHEKMAWMLRAHLK